MILSTQTEFLSKKYSIEKTIEILANAGYDAIDFSCFEMTPKDSNSPILQPNYREYAKHVKQVAEDHGIFFNQSHAPFPSSYPDEQDTKETFDKIVRSMEFASLLGVKNIVVHPKQHLKYADNVKELKEMNLEFYNSLIPYCKDFNITVCMENMWQYDVYKHTVNSTCASPEEFREYLDMIDSPYIKACLDIGHANILNLDIPRFISILGKDLAALHVHDTGYDRDIHVLPYFIMNSAYWDNILRSLAENDYKGDLTFEADNTLLHLPEELIIPGTEYMAKTGRYMVNRFESFKKQ